MQTFPDHVVYPDGTVYNGNLTDPNGNTAYFTSSGGALLAKDALGRTDFSTNIPIAISGQIPAGNYYVKTTGPTGNTETYGVTFSTTTLGQFSMPRPNPNSPYYDIVTNFYCISSINCPTNYSVQQPVKGASFSALTSISRPDGTSYTFAYDPVYGTISKITFPTGGYVRFQYAVLPVAATNYGQFSAVSDLVVTDVYTSTGSSSDEDQWTYQIAQATSAPPTSTVTAPDGSYTVYTGKCFIYSVVPLYKKGARPTCKEQSRAIYTSSGQLMKTVAENFGGDGLPAQVAISLYDGPNAMQQLVKNTYDSYDNVTEKDESDFYSCSGSTCPDPTTGTLPAPTGGWKRITYTQYAYTTNSALATAHIVNKPSQVLITDGGGTPFALTGYTYDSHGNLTYENKCLSISGSGSTATCSVQWQTQNTYDSHGQVTQKIEGYGITGIAATTTYTWTGPAGTTDSYNGYLTKVTHPNGATDQYTYYAPSGQINTHTGWNTNQTTTYTYVDPVTLVADSLNRVGSIKAPQTTDGTTGTGGNGLTTFRYTDTSGAFSVLEQHLITGSTNTSTTKKVDGLGRVITVASSVPTTQCSGGTVTVTTTYDSMSRVSTVSNPYCATGDATYGNTTYAYDALGRKTQTTLPDGAVSTISYAGNATETTDPPNGTTSVQHIQQVDGLGRLTDVCEVSSIALGTDLNPTPCALNIAGKGYLTHYVYDAIGNLKNVSQHGQSRTFNYDSSSRLQCAANPELATASCPSQATGSWVTGTMGYTYSTPSSPCAPDPGVPCTKTDPRGVKTTYTYDKMSRLVGKSYSTVAGNTTGSISDLSSCYQYDTALSGVTDSNPKGQLTAEWQQAGACPTSAVTTIPSGAVTVRIHSNHDLMGQTGEDQQCLLSTTCSATVGNFVYSYNLAGSPTQSNNGIQASAVSASHIGTNSTSMTAPSVTWMTTYDIAGHVQQAYVQDHPASTVWPTNVFSTDPTLLKPTSFDPFSHVTGAQIGIPYGSSTAGVTISRQYDIRSRLIAELDYGAGSTSSATHSLGTITIAGSEQGPVYPASSYARASASISGSEQSDTFNPCPPNVTPCPQTVYDSGSITLTVNGVSVTTSYGQGVSTSIMASTLAQEVNNSGVPAIATASGSTISLRATTPGTAGNSITISGASATGITQYFSSPSYTISTSAFSGGVNVSPTVYDLGTVTATVSGVPASVSFGSTSTPQSVASALASAIQNASGSKVTASSDGDVSVLVSSATGSSTDYTVSTSVTYDSTDFTQPSYMALAFAMQDGLASDSTDGLIYYYFVPNGGYAPNGNIVAHSDMITGDWIYAYDAVDRLTSAVAAGNNPSAYTGKIGCWTYDTYGNRKMEAFSSVACASNPTPQINASYNTANNHITTAGGATFTYDAAGNTLYDGRNNYWYDAEGQLCAVKTVSGAMIQYVYDAEGARVGQGTLTSVPGTSTATCAPPAPNSTASGLTSSMGLSLTKRYLVDLAGAQVSEFAEGASETWQHSNIWSGGKLVATYDLKGLHFELTDPLGTKRVQANIAGQVDATCTSLPFGNDVNNPMNPWQTSCVPKSNTINTLQTQDDATEHHFISRERDSETGNDYLLARYYSSELGRFTTPDWSAKEDPVPYATFSDPQTLNLYAYAANNPITHEDIDGHMNYVGFWCLGAQTQAALALDKQAATAQAKVRAQEAKKKAIQTTANVVYNETSGFGVAPGVHDGRVAEATVFDHHPNAFPVSERKLTKGQAKVLSRDKNAQAVMADSVSAATEAYGKPDIGNHAITYDPHGGVGGGDIPHTDWMNSAYVTMSNGRANMWGPFINGASGGKFGVPKGDPAYIVVMQDLTYKEKQHVE
jgi:RHS repeat-associated protein